MNVNKRNKRISLIREIITFGKITSQDELLRQLTDRGCVLTQATLSRDLKYMKVVKSPDANGDYTYRLPQEMPSQAAVHASFLAGSVVSLDFSGNIAVLHTRPGYASSMAYKIDDDASDVILGTVAGEDTVICIIKEGITQQMVVDKLNEMIPNLSKDRD